MVVACYRIQIHLLASDRYYFISWNNNNPSQWIQLPGSRAASRDKFEIRPHAVLLWDLTLRGGGSALQLIATTALQRIATTALQLIATTALQLIATVATT